MKATARNLVVAFLLLGGSCAWAQTKPDLKTQAVRTDTPPVIDGELDDAAWAQAEVLTDFIDTRLVRPAKDQTFARILYDDEFIYIGAEMIQDPSTIMSTIRKYDRFQLRFEDYIQIGFDTFFNRKEAYLFLVSPIGTRWDARDSVFGRNESWDAPWEAKTIIKDDRWIAEIRIPIGVMHHMRGENETWGMNFRRRNSTKDESAHWNYDPNAGVTRRASGPTFIADFGNMEGMDLSNSVVQVDPQFEVYVSGNYTKEPTGDVDRLGSTGLDLSLRLTPNWVSAFALNPDFGQVEADSDTIELRDTERFLPERRPFFNEGAEIFRTPMNVYNSRRIGDIKTGLKLTGGGKNWTMGVLDVQGESARSGDANFLVNRFTYNPNEEVQLGGMWVSAMRSNGYNVVAGPDLRIALNQTTFWTTQYLQEFDKNDKAFDGNGQPTTLKKSEHGFETELSGGTQPFFWEVDFKEITDDFNPDLAFISRQDVIGPGFNFRYDQEVAEGPIEGYSAFGFYQYYQNHDGDTVLRDYFGSGGFELRNNWDFNLSRMRAFRKPYDNDMTSLRVNYNRQNRLKSWSSTFSYGDFEDVPYEQVELMKPFGIGDRFTGDLTATLRTEHPNNAEDEDVWLVRLVNEYTFTWEGRVKLTIEESSEQRYNRTLLFAYEDVKSWDFYFVLNDVQSNDERSQGFFTKFVYRF